MKTTLTNHTYALAVALLLACAIARAQAPAPAPPPVPAPIPGAAPASIPAAPAAAAAAPTPVDTTSLTSLAWLEGCWRGAVNQREFREHWLPLRGGMMIGASHNVLQDKTLDYEYLRLESRADGIHYMAIPSGKPPTDFRLATAATDDNGTQFTFANVVDEFPQKLVYHRGGDGWLYASIEGTIKGQARKATYPYRRVDCETGEPILK